MEVEQSTKTPWKPELAFQVWQHCAAAGGADKDRMIHVVSWLLGFSAAIIGFALRDSLKSGYVFTSPLSVAILSVLGVGLSFLVIIVALLYGGYANRNWATADAISKEYGWDYLHPKQSPVEQRFEELQAGGALGRALRLSRTKDPYERLAPVFIVFEHAGRASLFIHCLLFAWAIICLCLGLKK